jgi:hypothetical protein
MTSVVVPGAFAMKTTPDCSTRLGGVAVTVNLPAVACGVEINTSSPVLTLTVSTGEMMPGHATSPTVPLGDVASIVHA